MTDDIAHAATVPTPSSRTATLVMPFPAASAVTPTGKITCARRLAEAGCTHHEIKAITGHKTDAEVRRYTAKADQVLLAHSAFEKLQDTIKNPKSANPHSKVSKHKENPHATQ